MSTTPASPISREIIDAFDRVGAVCLRRQFTADEIAALQDAVAWSMANPGNFALDFRAKGARSAFFTDSFMWTRNPAYRPLTVTERLAEIAGRLMGAHQIRFYFDHLLVKEPGSAAPTPWHQDAPYWPMSGRLCCSLWIALDPVTSASGAVEYVRGSHAWGKAFAPASFAGDDRLKNAALSPMPDIDANRADFEILSWDLAPGDIAVHHCMTLHGAPANETEGTRRGLALRFIGEDIRYDERPGMPEPLTGYIAELAPGMKIGDEYSGEWFPQLWQAKT